MQRPERNLRPFAFHRNGGVLLHDERALHVGVQRAAVIIDSHIKVLENLKKSKVDWTYFSPPGLFEPGERTGKFRLGKDDLISDAAGKSHVSMEDYAIAVADELEKPQHMDGQRFTIGY